MPFSPIDPLWVGLIVLVLFVLIYGLCYCLKMCVEAVKTGQKILIEQQESMSEKEKGFKRKGGSVGSRPHIRCCKMALTSCVLSGKQIICACAKGSSPPHVLCLPRDDNSADGLQPIRE